MDAKELKAEINRIVDLLPDDKLTQVLQKIRDMQISDEELRYEQNLRQIIAKNHSLLKRLAD